MAAKGKEFDDKIDDIARANGVYSYVHPKFVPYLINRHRAKRAIANECREIVRQGKKAGIICDDRSYAFFKKYEDKIRLYNFHTWNVGYSIPPIDEFERHLHEHIKDDEIDYLIFALPYRSNVHAISMAYGMKRDYAVINMYDLADYKGARMYGADIFFNDRRSGIIRSAKRLLFGVAVYYSVFIPALCSISPLLQSSPWIIMIMCAVRAFSEDEDIVPLDFRKKRMLAFLLKIRDFAALEDLEIGMLNGDETLHRINSQCKEVLDEIKEKIEGRKEQSIIFNWVDNISYEKMNEEMEWLSSYKEGCINFENCFTMFPWTKWTLRCLFSGKHLIRDKVFLLKDPVKAEKGTYYYYDKLQEMGYKIVAIGSLFFKMISCEEEDKKYGRDHCLDFSYSSEHQWNLLTKLAASDEKQFFLVHNFCETHKPFCYPFLYGTSYMNTTYCKEEQKVASHKYLDRELCWYASFYGNSIVAYMSDHGEETNAVNRCCYSDSRIHTFFFVKNPQMRGHKSYDKLLSIKDELEIIIRIVKEEDIAPVLSDSISIEVYDLYSRVYIDRLVNNGFTNDKGEWMQQQGIRNKDIKYVLFFDGEERLFELPDETTNHAAEKKYAHIVSSYREKLKPYFIDVFQYDFFMESRKLYEDKHWERE